MKFPAQKVHTAENGQAGLDLFREIRADVVLTDISMPVMDGIRMAREIRQLAPDACIIALSAHSRAEGPDDVDSLFTDYILKPFVGKQLFDAIEDCMAKIAGEER
jgi:YesN/AraC family two-component response regulator